MKILYTLFLVLFVALPATGQPSGGYAGAVKVEPVTFAERNDSLVIEFNISVCWEALNARQSWTVAPQLTVGTVGAAGDNQTGTDEICGKIASPDSLTFELPYALINGRQKARHYRRKTVFENERLLANQPYILTDIPHGTDTVIRYSITQPYELWMNTARLEIRQELLSSAGKRQLFITGGFGRVALEPREAYEINPQVNYLTPEREDKRRRVQGQAFLDFQAGRSAILPDYRRNPEELSKIADAAAKISNDPDVEITGIYIEGYASPEGSYALNERLSRERSEALSDYMSRSFGLDAGMFRVSSVAEDWDGLRLLVADSNIPQKDKIYAIIDSEDDYDRKEQRLRSLGGPWRTMLNELFPSLRRVEYRIDFSVKDYTVEESRELAGRSPEMLSQRELFVLAQSYPAGSPERDETLDLIFRLYPDDITAIVNSAAAMLERGEDATAKRLLDRIGDDPRAANNLGVYRLRAGELDMAQQYFDRAADAEIPEARHNLHEVELKREDNKVMERYNR